MPFSRPTIQQLRDRVAADLAAGPPGADPRLRRGLLPALARAQVGLAHGQHGHLDHVYRETVPWLATGARLEEHADWWGITRRPAAAASGTATLAGTDGATVPAGTVLRRADGAEYTTDAEATLAAGTATVAVTARAAGSAGTLVAGQALSLVSPVPGVQSGATVASATAGTDAEEEESLRGRLRARVQRRQRVGDGGDYEDWAREVSGVTRVWPLPHWLGLGTVGLAFCMDDKFPPHGIPGASEVAQVQAHIDARRGIGMGGVTVFAPLSAPLDIWLTVYPDTAEVRAAVEAELAATIRREAVLEDGTGRGVLLRSRLTEAVSAAAGERDHTLHSPAGNVVPAKGELLTLGTITWSAP